MIHNNKNRNNNHDSFMQLTEYMRLRVLSPFFKASVILLFCGIFLFLCPCIELKIESPLTLRDAIKNVSMTAGFSGILLTWLLQIINESECGMTMDYLYRHTFPHYDSQILVFFIATLFCIFCSCLSFHNDVLVKRIVGLFLLFFSELLCIVNMWIMCTLFLFSKEKRRQIAFAVLFAHIKDQLPKQLEEKHRLDLLNYQEISLWVKELPYSIKNGEENALQGFFSFIRISCLHGEYRERYIKELYYDIELLTNSLGFAYRQKLNVALKRYLPDEDILYLQALFLVCLKVIYEDEINRSGHPLMSSNKSEDLQIFIWDWFCDPLVYSGKADNIAGWLYVAFFCLLDEYDPINYALKNLNLHKRFSNLDSRDIQKKEHVMEIMDEVMIYTLRVNPADRNPEMTMMRFNNQIKHNI